MPTYTYACTERLREFDIRQSFTDDPLTDCPHGADGAGRLRKVIHPVGIAFKGSGFYKTDSRSKSGARGSGGPGAKMRVRVAAPRSLLPPRRPSRVGPVGWVGWFGGIVRVFWLGRVLVRGSLGGVRVWRFLEWVRLRHQGRRLLNRPAPGGFVHSPTGTVGSVPMPSIGRPTASFCRSRPP